MMLGFDYRVTEYLFDSRHLLGSAYLAGCILSLVVIHYSVFRAFMGRKLYRAPYSFPLELYVAGVVLTPIMPIIAILVGVPHVLSKARDWFTAGNKGARRARAPIVTEQSKPTIVSRGCVKCNSFIREWGFQSAISRQMTLMSSRGRDIEVERLGRQIGKVCPTCSETVCSVCYRERFRCPECGAKINFDPE